MSLARLISAASAPAVPPAHAQTFAFESDFVASLRCIPMAVRFKLDRCLIKLTLRQWSRFTRGDREWLLLRPCDSFLAVEAYRAALVELVQARAGEEARALAPLTETPWENASEVAPTVVRFAESVKQTPPSLTEWAALSELQRFVLVKLARDNHDNVNFVPALKEFGLA